MCGIAGLFQPDDPPNRVELEKMSEPLCHRGPDDEGYYQDGPLGFAHRRLSIIDLETGQQPITNEDGSIVVVFNGEIYNYRNLREALQKRGHSFTTATDTEVLVHAYEEYGLDFLNHLSGMFAFALWDGDAEQVVLARDQIGIKPLYVAGLGKTHEHPRQPAIAFGSELPSVLASEIPHGGLDRDAMARYFAFGFVPAPRTAFSNVSMLRPGERVVVSKDGIDRADYYTPSITQQSPGLDKAANELRTRVETAIERRLMADVPLGAFLSGGIDSSIVVGTMAQLADDPIKTFTVGFEESMFDESWAAHEVAEFHCTDHHEMTVTADEVRDVIPEVLGQLGQPFADQSLVPTYLVARETSDHVKVALSGDGADELFAGYDKYLGEYYSQYYRKLPDSVRQTVLEPLISAFPASRENRLGEFTRKLQKFTRGGVADTPSRHMEWLRLSNDSTDRAFPTFDPELAGKADLKAEHDAIASMFTGPRDDLSRIQAVDTRYTLPNQMLQKVDLASMYNSLEVRVPFLDTEVVEYTMSLPTFYKITPRQRKRILKSAFDDILPDTILERPKQGFDMPIGEWLKDDLADEFESRINALNTSLLDIGEVRELYTEHTEGTAEHGKFLWAVYVYAIWANKMREQGVLKTL